VRAGGKDKRQLFTRGANIKSKPYVRFVAGLNLNRYSQFVRRQKNLLLSLLKETKLLVNGSQRLHHGKPIERTASDLYREVDEAGEYQSSRSCSKDRCSPAKCKSDLGSEEKRVDRLHFEDGREHRSRCGDEGQKADSLKKASGEVGG